MPTELPPDFRGTKPPEAAPGERASLAGERVGGIIGCVLKGVALVVVTTAAALVVTVAVAIIVGLWRFILSG